MKPEILFVCATAAILFASGCSQETRDEAIQRTARAAEALNGGAPDGTPDIVREQRERERERQNSEWTPENQAKHPIEYCQAQLEKLRQYEQELEVSAHKVAVAKSEAARKLAYDNTQIKNLQSALDAIKAAYREAEASGEWPLTIGGSTYSQDSARTTILESSRRLKILSDETATLTANIGKLDAKFKNIGEEQRKLTALRARVQTTLDDLKTKAVVAGSESVGTALDSINDSILAFDLGAADPGLDNLLELGKKSVEDEEFAEIMAK